MILESHSGSIQRAPFPYSVVTQALSLETSTALLEWLETDAPWRLKIADFYEQYEFSLVDAELPNSLAPLFGPQSLIALRQHLERVFGTRLGIQIDITAHKLVTGQRIRIHNDFIAGQESHRLLIQLNRGWADENGGALIFFNSNDSRDIHKIFRPIHNTGVMFEISPCSLHAVSPISAGERFTLVFSFYRESSCETPLSTSEPA